ncbi:polyribonucleotide nucleotidyltransferase 2, mitochondrial [Aristolochia californica]|uniref:polyribonucleotide nucleotidyltransferase 2, mitochondrial n=1 Tax=Aristolochia californica TaxID=171875 RepID=UPI0035DC10A1
MAISALISRSNLLLSNVPVFLMRWKPSFRTIYSGRLGFMSSLPDPDTPVARTHVLETFTEEFEIGSRIFKFETGKIAWFANGAVVMGIEDTKVLSTVTSAKGDGVRDFLPLSVEYQERQYAQGLIPTTFMRREGAPKERELICGRIIDRPIRPLFPSGFYHEIQAIATVLSSDGKQDPDIIAANATSAALMLSDIPWRGPIGVIRIGRINGQFVVIPTTDELSLSDLNLVYACTKDKTLMIDVQAREISERDLEAGLRLAHLEAGKFIEPQLRLASKAGKSKKQYKLSMISDATLEKIGSMAESSIENVFSDPKYGKFERGEALDKIAQDVRNVLEEEGDEESLKVLSKAVDTVRKGVVRRRIIKKGLRVDGRQLDEVRPLQCESGYLSRLHGSSIFSRGYTQVLCTVTLGAPGDAQRLDSLVGPPTKRFMLHYSFPPYSINEVGKRVGLNRREVGHGTLAEKALLAVLPPEDDLPFTVRINSEVMASDGSTSMATVCAGSMALLDAGIPLKEHVAGLSVGLISEVDPSTGEIKDYRILTDILGLEDHLGDMDFKIAGTRRGVTAVQLDIKPAGIPLNIICQCLEPALKGRLQIIDHMEKEINAPRPQDDRNSPRIITFNVSNEGLRRLWPHKKRIEDETGARVSIGDGTVTTIAKNQECMEKALQKVYFLTGREIEVGGIYKGVVTTVKEFGAFVEFNGGQQGLLHISELSHEKVFRVSDVVSIGQELSLKCIDKDVRGNISLSLKATLPQPQSDDIKIKNPSSIKETEDACVVTEESAVSAEKQDTDLKDVLIEKNNDDRNTFFGSPPSIIIRSAAECDAQECSTDQTSTTKNVGSVKSSASSKLQTSTGLDYKRKSSAVNSLNSSVGAPVRKRVSSSTSTKNQKEKDKIIITVDENETSADRSKLSGSVSPNSLKIGDKFTAKVHQIRARGLVLQLGGRVLGMYRFEVNGRKNFEVGKELQVVCSSFSSKGIPVVSLLDDE